MPIWAKRRFTEAAYRRAYDDLQQAFYELGCPRDMMLVATDPSGGEITAYVWAPDEARLARFPGFEPVADPEVPTIAALVFGHQEEFMRLLDYPHALWVDRATRPWLVVS